MNHCIYPFSRHGGVVIDGDDRHDIWQLPPETVAEAFRREGVVLIRGFECNEHAFVAYTNELGVDFSTYVGGAFHVGALERRPVKEIETLLTTTGEGQSFEIPLHGEMYYTSRPPGVVWFYCALPPQRMGETTVCSGRHLWAGLTEETRRFLRSNPIKYSRQLTAAQWRQTFQTDSLEALRRWCEQDGAGLAHDPATDAVWTEYICPAMRHRTGEEVFINNLLAVATAEVRMGRAAANVFPMRVRMADGSVVPETVLAEIRAVGEQYTTNIVWRAGDFVMINNRTHLHGRRETDGGERRVCVRLGDFRSDLVEPSPVVPTSFSILL